MLPRMTMKRMSERFRIVMTLLNEADSRTPSKRMNMQMMPMTHARISSCKKEESNKCCARRKEASVFYVDRARASLEN